MANEDELDPELLKEIDRTIAVIRSSPMDEHAQEIGRLSVVWSNLEISLMIFVELLLEIKDRTIVNIVLGALDMRAKTQILIPLAFARKPSDEWFDRVQTLVNTIDNDLRPERNRMVHDFWTIETKGEAARRFQMVSRVVKDQRSKKLTLANMKPVLAKEITLLTVRVAQAAGALDLLREEYGGPAALPQIPQPPVPPGSPDRDHSQ